MPKRPGRYTLFSPEEAREKFLSSLSRYGNVTVACKAARISLATAYRWRDEQPEFRAQWKEALRSAEDVLAREAWRRAVSGTKKPVYQGGELVGSVQEYSDTLLIFLLKAANPEKYRERQQVEHSGSAKLIVEYRKDWRSANKEGSDGDDN